MRATVETGARLHFGFQNLSLDRERLFGSLGVALDEPRVVVTAEPAGSVECDHPVARGYAERAAALLDVAGARVAVESTLPRHAGLGSGSQLALATYSAVAHAHGEEPRVREHAPALGRGRRSGIGVAAFEDGGFLLDAGQPAERFADGSPEAGEWTVPSVILRRRLPEDWRFVLVLPDARPGRSGDDEAASMRSVLADADPAVADRIGATVSQRVLPALATGRVATFGAAVATVDLLNGSWFAPEQGDVYRPPTGAIVGTLAESESVFGAGQSSWGPAVYGVTSTGRATEAEAAGRRALARAGVGGRVRVVRPRNEGATVGVVAEGMA